MEEKIYSENQLVWAKIRGFAWWPAIVRYKQVKEIVEDMEDGDSLKYRVDFIGENTQQVLYSSVLKPTHIKDFMQNFDKLSKNPSKVLKKCIKEALKFNNGQYTPEKLNEINRINFSEEKKSRNGIKVRQKKAVKTHVIVERQRLKTDITQEQQWALLKASFKKLQSQKQDVNKQIDLNKLRKACNIISNFQGQRYKIKQSNTMTIDTAFFALKQLILIDPNPKHLIHTNALHIIKQFKEQFIDNQNEDLQQMAKAAHKLYIYWQQIVLQHKLDTLMRKTKQKFNNFQSIPIWNQEDASSASESSSDSEIEAQYQQPSQIIRKDTKLETASTMYEELIEILKNKGFRQNQYLDKAIKFQNFIRKHDPSIGERYLELFKKLLSLIERLEKVEITNVNAVKVQLMHDN